MNGLCAKGCDYAGKTSKRYRNLLGAAESVHPVPLFLS